MPESARSGPYFGPDAMRFLKELTRNNNRAWFQANKARYEAEIQAPAIRFIEAMGPRLSRISPHLVADARPFGGSLSRIYRDTRFSKDKSPYKTYVGIHFSHDRATESENLPGFYLHISPGESGAMSGVWHPSPPALGRIRDAIVARPEDWTRARKGLDIGGDSYVRVPAGYDPKHRFAADLRRKDFFASKSISDRDVGSPDFGAKFESSCRVMNPLNRFLAGAMGAPW